MPASKLILRLAAAGFLIAATTATLSAQDQTTCGNALGQLQNYVSQVNYVANAEYYQGIPSRCGYNGYCAQTLLQQLGAWYSQQAAMVNQWYAQLVQTCTSRPTPNARIGSKSQTGKRPGELDEDAIDELEVDDEDKVVRIKIPSTPRGYR